MSRSGEDICPGHSPSRHAVGSNESRVQDTEERDKNGVRNGD